MSWKRTLLVFVASVVLLAAGTWLLLRRTGMAKAFVQRVLAKVIASSFVLDRADLDLGGGTLTLTDLQIAHPADANRPLLQAKDIQVSVNTNPLGEVGRVDKLVLRGLRIDDLQVAGSGAVRFDDIVKAPEGTADGATPFPAIVIEDASVGLRFSDATPPLRFEDVDLELMPLEAGSEEMVLTGAMTTLLGTRVAVSGQGNLRTQHFRVLAKATGLELAPLATAPFSADVARALAAAELAGHVATAQLWIEVQEGGELRGGFQVEADELSLRAPQFPRRMRGAARINGSLQDEGTVNLQFDARDERGGIALAGSVQRLFAATPEVSIALTLQGLRVDDELLQAVAAQPAGARVLTAFSPVAAGEVSGEARVEVRDRALRVAIDAELRGMSASFTGFRDLERSVSFPYPLHDVGGRLQIRDRMLTLDALTGNDPRGGKLEISGKVPLVRGSGSGQVTIRGRGIAFCDELRTALLTLAPRAAEHYDACAANGTADVEVAVTGIGGGAHTGYRVRIEPRQAAAAHATFPCRITGVSGFVEIDDRGVVFDLTGERAGKGVVVRGRFPRDSDPGEQAPRSELWVKAEDLSLDDELRAATELLAPATAALWPALAPRGRVAADVAAWQAMGAAQFSYHVRLDVLDGEILPRAFPLPLTDLRGPVLVQGDGSDSRVDVHLLRGKVQQEPAGAPAEVFLSGVATTKAGTTVLDLTTVARSVVLRPELRDVLDRLGALSRAAWDALSPQGSVDVIARQRAEGLDGDLNTHLRMQLRDVSIQADWLPAPVSKLNGEIEAVGGRATTTELRGLLGAAPVIVRDGELSHGERDSRVRGVITADEVPMNDDLARLFGKSPLREAFLRRQVRGQAKLTALHLDCTMPDAEGPGFRLIASGQLLMRDCAFTMAVPVEHVDGILAIHDCRVDDTSGSITGALANVSLQVLGRPLHDLSAAFRADADDIEFDDLSVRFCGGRVVGTDDGPHLHYLTEGEGSVAANVSWQGVRLSELTGDGQRGGTSGNVAGRLALDSLPGTRLIDAAGRGELHISGGRLGEVPIFRTIYAILRRQPQFTSADAYFRLGDRRIDIDHVTLGSQLLDVKGKGHVTLDGYLDLDIELPDLFGDAADFLLLPEILHSAVAQVLEFKLHGYLRDPQVTPLTPFQRNPERRGLDPIPAALPELPRPRF